MLRIFQHAHTIHKEVCALLGNVVADIGVVRLHDQRIARIVRRNGRLARGHLVKDLVHDVRLHQRLLCLELLCSRFPLGRRQGVHGVAQLFQRKSERITGIIKHQDIARILFIPQQVNALIRHIGRVNHRLVVDNHGRTPCIGNGILIVRVIGQTLVVLADVGIVRDIGKIQLRQQILLDHLADHIVRGDDDIVAGAAGFQLGVHRFIGIVIGIDDPDAGDLLKGLVDIQRTVGAVGNIFAPVVNADGIALVLIAAVVIHIQRRGVDARPLRQRPDGAEAGESQHQRRQQGKDTLFHSRSSFPIICFSFLAE